MGSRQRRLGIATRCPRKDFGRAIKTRWIYEHGATSMSLRGCDRDELGKAMPMDKIALRNSALHCNPSGWLLNQWPDICTNSPGEIMVTWPTTVTKSRWSRISTQRTQKPFSALWNVILSEQASARLRGHGVENTAVFICPAGRTAFLHRSCLALPSRDAAGRKYLYDAPVSGTTHNYDSALWSTRGYAFSYYRFPLK
ncbi:hypothetical protein A0J51_03162 [Gluconobacter japonicus]|nr:hypothetical protein A0J51_03162 [Gluconobacter japonicus]